MNALKTAPVIEKFKRASDYFKDSKCTNWSLVNLSVEFDHLVPRINQQASLIKYAEDNFSEVFGFKKTGKAKFHFLIVEQFEGVGSKFRFLKRTKEIKSIFGSGFSVFRQVILENALYKLSYLVVADDKRIELSKICFGSLGLICFNDYMLLDKDLQHALDVVDGAFARDTLLVDQVFCLLANNFGDLFRNCWVFSFSGEFDDPWVDLRVYEELAS